MHVRVEALEGLATSQGFERFRLPPRPWLNYSQTVKPVLDTVLAVLLLVATLPFWIAIAVAVKLDSRGPAFHVQERLGLNGRRFRFYKFRSMHLDAERRQRELTALNEMDGPVFKIRNDPRVTRVGRLLRRTSLDELPQLINVIRGEMSLVGPRPPLPSEVERYSSQDRVRLTVKPGLTCLWQVSGRSNSSFPQWMALDREYVKRICFWVDVTILLRTILAVLSCRGAY
jgi:lipopolysaccharide/colanic/teichoic acid biosynthesis glycosyltransferase